MSIERLLEIKIEGVCSLSKKKIREHTFKNIIAGIRPPSAELYAGSNVIINSYGGVQIEDCKGITQYNENYVEVDMGRCKLRISGDEITLEQLTKKDIAIQGKIVKLEFFY